MKHVVLTSVFLLGLAGTATISAQLDSLNIPADCPCTEEIAPVCVELADGTIIPLPNACIAMCLGLPLAADQTCIDGVDWTFPGDSLDGPDLPGDVDGDGDDAEGDDDDAEGDDDDAEGDDDDAEGDDDDAEGDDDDAEGDDDDAEGDDDDAEGDDDDIKGEDDAEGDDDDDAEGDDDDAEGDDNAEGDDDAEGDNDDAEGDDDDDAEGDDDDAEGDDDDAEGDDDDDADDDLEDDGDVDQDSTGGAPITWGGTNFQLDGEWEGKDDGSVSDLVGDWNRAFAAGEIQVVMWPNPATATASVEVAAGIVGMHVMSATGATVLSEQFTETTRVALPTAAWNPGTYIVRILTGDGEVAQRLLQVVH